MRFYYVFLLILGIVMTGFESISGDLQKKSLMSYYTRHLEIITQNKCWLICKQGQILMLNPQPCH